MPAFRKYGSSEPSAEAPHIELSSLGEAVEKIWLTIGDYHPEVKVMALQHAEHKERRRGICSALIIDKV